MNINEVEVVTGLTRANIRYYEKEGLIEVERLDNKYRNYSSENIRELRKIILLRRLGLSVDTIRNIKCGQADMEQALEERMENAGDEAEELLTAKAICKKMLDEHIRFEDLDAMKYIELFESGRTDILKRDVPEKGHPWRRFFAMYTDMFFYGAVLNLIFLLAGRDCTITISLDILFTALVIITMFFTEPLLLSLFGTTPGKRIFGIYVYLSGGKKMSYVDGLYRCFYRIKYGLGFYIPFYSIYRLYKSFEACSENEIMPWDDEYGTEIRLKNFSWKNIAIWAVAFVAALGAVIFITVILALPPNKGNVTPEQFAENYNYSSKYKGYDFYIEPNEKGENYGMFTEDAYPKRGTIIHLGPAFAERHIYYKTDENGYVIETGFVIEGSNDLYYSSWSGYEYRLMWAFMMADEKLSSYFSTEAFISNTTEGPFDSGTYFYDGFTIKKEVDTTGYKFKDDKTIIRNSNDAKFSIRWSISKNNR